MTLFYRRVVYIAFIIIFLITAPAAILYTSGYRYSLSKGRIQKTGVLKISSIPKGAEIWLNGKKYETQNTPAKIQYVLPSDYEIKLSKEGYYDWQKKLAVYDNGTTFAEKVILWQKNSPQELTASTGVWDSSDDNNKIAFASSSEVWLLNVDSGLIGINTEKLSLLTALPKDYTIKDIAFSPSGQKILITAEYKGKKEYWLKTSASDKAAKINGSYDVVHFNHVSDEIYGLNKTGLVKIIDRTLSGELLINKLSANDFLINNKTVYFNNKKILSQISLNDNSKAVSDLEEINCPNCSLRDLSANKIILLDKIDQNILVVDLNRQQKTVKASAKAIDWLSNDSLLFYNDWEIFIFDLKKKEPELITRLGEPISSVVWHPKGRHLFFASGQKISVIELDNRELRYVINLVENIPADRLQINSYGNNLYYLSNQKIYKLILQ